MPPMRRARQADPSGSPYNDGWLSYRRRRRPRLVGGNVRGESDDDVSGGAPPSATTLPDDVLFGIFSRVSCLADAARCAATCRRWGRVVAARAAPISRALPPPPGGGFLPQLFIGVLLQHQEKNDDVLRRRRASAGGGATRLRFVPTAALASRSRLLGDEGQGVAPFDDARPVASRNGRVVLQLGRKERADGLTLCVWNPMTGDVAMVPTLSGKEFPGDDDYACAILTGDDDDAPLCCSPGSFRLLLAYGRRGFTALRSFSSDTGSWGPECKKPGAKLSGHLLRHQLGPAVVLHGVAYWPMHRAALGVRLGSTAAPAEAAMDVCSVPYRYSFELDEHVLGVSADGRRLNFVDIGIMGHLGKPIVNLSASWLEDAVAVGGDKTTTTTTTTNSGDPSDDEQIPMPQIKVARTTPIKPWWFGEKSGTLVFTVEEETSRTSAVFALNVATRSLEKLADGVSNHTCCRRLFGYEMDRAALLASVAPQ